MKTAVIFILIGCFGAPNYGQQLVSDKIKPSQWSTDKFIVLTDNGDRNTLTMPLKATRLKKTKSRAKPVQYNSRNWLLELQKKVIHITTTDHQTIAMTNHDRSEVVLATGERVLCQRRSKEIVYRQISGVEILSGRIEGRKLVFDISTSADYLPLVAIGTQELLEKLKEKDQLSASFVQTLH